MLNATRLISYGPKSTFIAGAALLLITALQGTMTTDENATDTTPVAAPIADMMKMANTDGADEAASFQEYNAIKKTLHLYIDNASPSDGDAMRPAFYDHAHVVGAIGGTVYNTDADGFVKIVSSHPKSPDLQYHIAWIDVSGNAAAARLEFINWHGYRFTDLMVLYKEKGQWKISGKVYNAHSKS